MTITDYISKQLADPEIIWDAMSPEGAHARARQMRSDYPSIYANAIAEEIGALIEREAYEAIGQIVANNVLAYIRDGFDLDEDEEQRKADEDEADAAYWDSVIRSRKDEEAA